MNLSEGERYERRRAQVRRAQKNHRARTATYVKSLEDEIRGLREQNATLRHDVEIANNTIRGLQGLLQANGVPFPDDMALDSSTIETSLLATATVTRSPLGLSLQARFPAARVRSRRYRELQKERAVSRAGSSSGHEAILGRSASSSSGHEDLVDFDARGKPGLTEPQSALRFSRPSLRPALASFDLDQVAIDFILRLEHPCLYHHKIESLELVLAEGVEADGHQLMLSSPILDHFSPPLVSMRDNLQNDVSWPIPTAALESLLDITQHLDFDLSKEITPVQIWQTMRSHLNFLQLAYEDLEVFKEKLAPHVTCHGFGAVIEIGIFERFLAEAFANIASKATENGDVLL